MRRNRLVSARPLKTALLQIRKLVAPDTGTLTDRELLARFVAQADDGAFAALVERHASRVLRVCRGVLRDAHDAEDACQAAFLVLACKAGSVRKAGSLGCWLHGVAFRVATRLQRQISRRRAREHMAADRSSPTIEEPSWREVRGALDHELERLPERLRAPLILCYLEGKTRDEAARELGWNLNTLRGRLHRGRLLLRRRLIRRGLTLSAALMAIAISQDALSAGLPAAWTAQTIQAALRLAGGRAALGIVSQEVITLTQGVLRTMRTTQKLVMGLILLFSFVALTIGLCYSQPAGPVQTSSQPSAVAPAVPKAVGVVQANADPLQEITELVALAEKDVAIKKAELKVALAHKTVVEARLKTLAGKLRAADAVEKESRNRLDRLKKLQETGAVDQSTLGEALVAHAKAVAERQEAEAQIITGEAEVALETAKVEVAEAELDKSALRLKLLQNRKK
jgi:RNA polymerase sigma factor (sigma-70 family)